MSWIICKNSLRKTHVACQLFVVESFFLCGIRIFPGYLVDGWVRFATSFALFLSPRGESAVLRTGHRIDFFQKERLSTGMRIPVVCATPSRAINGFLAVAASPFGFDKRFLATVALHWTIQKVGGAGILRKKNDSLEEFLKRGFRPIFFSRRENFLFGIFSPIFEFSRESFFFIFKIDAADLLPFLSET